jgi:hypothetical protein
MTCVSSQLPGFYGCTNHTVASHGLLPLIHHMTCCPRLPPATIPPLDLSRLLPPPQASNPCPEVKRQRPSKDVYQSPCDQGLFTHQVAARYRHPNASLPLCQLNPRCSQVKELCDLAHTTMPMQCMLVYILQHAFKAVSSQQAMLCVLQEEECLHGLAESMAVKDRAAAGEVVRLWGQFKEARMALHHMQLRSQRVHQQVQMPAECLPIVSCCQAARHKCLM